MNLIHESHSIVPPDPALDKIQKLGLGLLGIGLSLLLAAILQLFQNSSNSPIIFWIMLSLIFAGGITYGLRTHLKRKPGISNNNITTSSVTARGAAGWLLGIFITSIYTIYYWFPGTLIGLTRIFDPLSLLIRNRDSDVWFVYGSLYTIAVLIMGIKAIVKYRHSRYQILRTSSIMGSQLILAYTIPYLMERFDKPYFAPNYFWPLAPKYLWPEDFGKLAEQGDIGMFVIGWGIIMILIATPVLTYYFGKRWYCSWVCGCGGLANTAGDSWRQLSDKSTKAWKIERYTIHAVLVFVLITTALLWIESSTGFLGSVAQPIKKIYGFLIISAFAGVIGVGFYPIMGTRVWCRFGCPQAAILGLIQRFKSRFRITTNGAQCISCGNCSKYCEMGIDVRWYAQRGQDIARASCVGCGMCSAVCPRGVLNLENGPTELREEYQIDLLASVKSRNLESEIQKERQT